MQALLLCVGVAAQRTLLVGCRINAFRLLSLNGLLGDAHLTKVFGGPDGIGYLIGT